MNRRHALSMVLGGLASLPVVAGLRPAEEPRYGYLDPAVCATRGLLAHRARVYLDGKLLTCQVRVVFV